MIVVTRHGVDLSKNRVYNLSRCIWWQSLKVWGKSLNVFGDNF